MIRSYIAIGGSFAEGIGGWIDDDTTRGWADTLAEAWASALAQS